MTRMRIGGIRDTGDLIIHGFVDPGFDIFAVVTTVNIEEFDDFVFVLGCVDAISGLFVQFVAHYGFMW